MNETVLTVDEMLATARKKVGLKTLALLDMRIIQWNEEWFHEFEDATFSDLSVDVEEHAEELKELTDYLSNEYLLEECDNRTLGETSPNLASVWRFMIDFEEGTIEAKASTVKILETKSKNGSFKLFPKHDLL